MKLSSKWNFSRILALIFISLLMVFILPLLYIQRQIINHIFELYYGKQYGGMLENADCMWATEKDVNQCVTVLFVFKSWITNPKEFLIHVKNNHSKIFDNSLPKITSIRKTFLGYGYLLKNQVTMDDAIKIVKIDSHNKECLEDSDLQNIINKIANKPLEKGLIEIHLIPKPVKWKISQGTERYYAVVYKVHHIIGEGLGLLMFCLGSFADDQTAVSEFKSKLVRIYPHKSNKEKGFITKLKLLFARTVLLLKIPLYLSQKLEKGEKSHELSVNNMDSFKSSGVNLIYAVESEEQKSLSKVMEIRRRVPGTTFSVVILAAICRAIEGNSAAPFPEYLSLLVVALAHFPDLNTDVANLKNFCASAGSLNLPLMGSNSSTKNTLGLISEATNRLKNSDEVQLNHIMMNYVFELIPLPILKRVLSLNSDTTCLSSIPGPPKCNFFNGQELVDVVGLIGLPTYLGLGFCILTYDERLHIGITAKKGLFSEDETKTLAQSAMEQIDIMYQEIISME